MTTIIAVQKSDHVLIAADSQASAGSEKIRMDDPKIRENGEYTFAIAGLYALLNELEYADLPPVDPSMPLRKFVSTVLAPAIRDIESGLLEDLDVPGEVRSMMRSEVLIAVKGTLFSISGGVLAPRTPTGVYVVGSGSPYALGALSGVVNPGEPDILSALRVAEYSDVGTSGPFLFKKIQ